MPRGLLLSQAAGRGPHVSPPEGPHGVEGNTTPAAPLMSSSAAGHDCCGGLGNIDFRQVARWEQRTRKLSRAFRSPYLACYFLGSIILLLNVLRSHCFTQAMMSQPKMEDLDNHTTYFLGLALLGGGIVFVLSSFFALGFTGTFLGDYFGILKEARVTSFPFNVLDNPMYWGSTANYLGWALIVRSETGHLQRAMTDVLCTFCQGLLSSGLKQLGCWRNGSGAGAWQRWHASPTGLLLTVLVAIVYVVALLYEEPFTAEIYRQKATRSHKRS